MIRLAETRDAGEAVCLRQERNFTLPQSIEDGFFCDNTEEDSVWVSTAIRYFLRELWAIVLNRHSLTVNRQQFQEAVLHHSTQT